MITGAWTCRRRSNAAARDCCRACWAESWRLCLPRRAWLAADVLTAITLPWLLRARAPCLPPLCACIASEGACARGGNANLCGRHCCRHLSSRTSPQAPASEHVHLTMVDIFISCQGASTGGDNPMAQLPEPRRRQLEHALQPITASRAQENVLQENQTEIR